MKKSIRRKVLSLLMALVLVVCGTPLAPVYGADEIPLEELAPDIEAPEVAPPDMTAPEAGDPEVTAPDIADPEVADPEASAPDLPPAPDESELTGGLITAFSELPEEIRWQNTESPVFPETVEAMAEGHIVEIPVTWEADHDYNAQYPQRGLYVFTAVLGEGYFVAEGIDLPRITVYIPQSTGMMMARMAGSGSVASPLEITTAAQLAEIATLVNAGRLESFILNNAPNAKVSLKLMNDIDLSAYSSGEGWTSIGTWDNRFKGIFDGNGKVISGLYIKRNASFQGLFGYVSGGTIQNLGLINIDIKGTQNVGGIAGYIVDGTVQNCYTTGSVGNTTNGGFRYLGGVVGQVASGTVKNCYSTASVSGTASSYSVRAGGVVGQAQENTVVENSYSTGNVSGTVSGSGVSVGGVVGYSASGATVKNCYSTGSVSGTVSGSSIGTYVGGVVGYLSSSSSSTSTVQNCVALNSSISGTGGDFGRVVGIDYGTLSNNYAFSGMKVNGSTVITDDPSSKDGKLLDRDHIVNADFPDGLFDSESWTVVPDKLPVLNGLAGQDGTLPFQFHIRGSFEGEGTSESPYLIKTAADLANLAELVNAGNTAYNDKHYRLENNLDLSAYGVNYDSGKGWTPIGAYSADSSKAFKGNFDGNSHVISGLYINRSSEHQGLFGYIYGGTVINLGLTDVNISGTGSVGGVAGRVDNSSKIQNSYSTGSVRGTGNNVGGMAGLVNNSSTIQNCYSTGSVSGTGDQVGGVAGYANESIIQNCYSHSGVTGRDYVGGVAGWLINGTVENCYSIGSVRGTRDYVGGVAGTANSGSTIQNSYSTGNVRGDTYVGGVAGSVNSSTIQNSYSTGSVIGTNFVGGVAGRVIESAGTSGTVDNSAALNSSVIGTDIVGRVVGYTHNATSLSNNYAFSDMTVKIGSSDKSVADDINGLDGKSISASKITEPDYPGGLFSGETWIVASGLLPVLKDIGGQDGTIPFHIRNSFEGECTSAKPYLIKTAADLAKLAELVNAGNTDYNDKHYKLVNNIDLSAYGEDYNDGEGWTPIGKYNISESDYSKVFKGIFNGNGKVITGLYINRNSQQYQGLFGWAVDAIIENVSLANVNIRGSGRVGGVVGDVKGTVQNCYITGSVSGTSSYVGGVAGMVSGSTVQNCYSSSSVEGNQLVGGVVGSSLNSTVQNCYSTGSVSSNGSAGTVGGVVGLLLNGGSVQNCVALNSSVSLTGSGTAIGRVVGYKSAATLSHNYAFNRLQGPWENIGLNAIDGQDVTASTLFKQEFWTTPENWNVGTWDNSIWTFAANELPVLTGLAGQSGDGGLHLLIRDIQYATVTLSNDNFTYNGGEQRPDLTVEFDGETLQVSKDYTLAITSTDGAGTSAGTNAGVVTLTLTGQGNFTGTVSKEYTIAKAGGPAAPTGLAGAAPSSIGGADGKITGTTVAMEYARNADFSDGADCTDSETVGLSAGTYYVRIKATANYEAGAYATVTVPEGSGGSGSGGGGGGSQGNTQTTSISGQVIDATTGEVLQGLTAQVGKAADGTAIVRVKSQEAVVFKQQDGTPSSFGDASRLAFTPETNKDAKISMGTDGTIEISNLAPSTQPRFVIQLDLGNNQKITIGYIEVKVDASGNVTGVFSNLIDPYGTIIDAATGQKIAGAHVTLYYADTERNKQRGIVAHTPVDLPILNGFEPNNNKNPQYSD